MATLGQVTGNYHNTRSVCLMAGLTVANGQPSASTDGVPVYISPDAQQMRTVDSGVAVPGTTPESSSIKVKVVGSGGTVSATIRLWGWSGALAEWLPIGVGDDTTKGLINAGNSIGATKTNKAIHCEPFLYVGHFGRLYAELVSISGTSATAEVWIAVPVSERR